MFSDFTGHVSKLEEPLRTHHESAELTSFLRVLFSHNAMSSV